MRQFILIAACALASCSGDGPANNAVATGGPGGGEVSAVNDVTAIDAATGEAADMAADVNYTFNEIANNAAGNGSGNSAANASD